MFGFEKIEHKTFKKNFLKTVVFQFSYKKSENFQKNKEEIKKLFLESFPRAKNASSSGIEISFNQSRTPLFSEIKKDDGLEMKSIDGQKALIINNNSFTLTVGGRVYSDYETLKIDLMNIKRFLKLCDINEVNRLAIRKINIAEFKVEDDPTLVFKMLINPDLLGNLNSFPNCKNLKQNIQSLNFIDDENHLNIKYGYNVIQPNNEAGQVIIDIDLFKQGKIEINKILSLADEINSEIFNIFQWLISEYTEKLLNE